MFAQVAGTVIVIGFMIAIYFYGLEGKKQDINAKFNEYLSCPPGVECVDSLCNIQLALFTPKASNDEKLMENKCNLVICNKETIAGIPGSDYSLKLCRKAVAQPEKPGDIPLDSGTCAELTNDDEKFQQLVLSRVGTTTYKCKDVFSPIPLKLEEGYNNIHISFEATLMKEGSQQETNIVQKNVKFISLLED